MANGQVRRAANAAFGAAAGFGDDNTWSAAFGDAGSAKRRFSAADTGCRGRQSGACSGRRACTRARACTRGRRGAGRSQQGLRPATWMGAAGPEPASQSADCHGERDVATSYDSSADTRRGHHRCCITAAGTSADSPRTRGDTGACTAGPNGCGRAGAIGKSEQGLRAATGMDATWSGDAGQHAGGDHTHSAAAATRGDNCRCAVSPAFTSSS